MEQIKYRAWHEQDKRWLTVFSLHCEDGTVLSVEEPDGKRHNIKDIYLMQFTGLKDKHGTQIYAGDLVLHNTTSSDIGEVKSCVGGFEVLNWRLLKAGGAVEGSTYTFSCLSDRFCKVIGNIYEQPFCLK